MGLFDRPDNRVLSESKKTPEVWGVPTEVPDSGSIEAPRKRRGIVRKGLGVIGVAAALVAVAYGTGLMRNDDNMEDFGDLRAFTSAEHQNDRCNVQDAFNAQVKMNEHFEAKGGVTQAEADLMGPVVGLDPDEVKGLIETKLFPMDYDCDVAVASSQEATTGLILAVGGGALLVGGVAGAALKRKA